MGFLDLFFPKNCLVCGQTGAYMCRKCLAKVEEGVWRNKSNYSVFRYKGVVRKAILTLKYKFAFSIAAELAVLLANNLKGKMRYKNAVLVPIPLHRLRKNWRGFNQVEEIAKLLASEMGWVFDPSLLTKPHKTKTQVGLKSAARHTNLAKSFLVNETGVSKTSPIILFDDVYTTGSTMRMAEKALQKAGFEDIFKLTIAG